MNYFFRDQNPVKLLLISIIILVIAAIIFFARKRRKSRLASASEELAGQAPKFAPIPKTAGIWLDAGRALLIIISILVALAGTIILLPQETVDALCRKFQSRHMLAQQERIALLYLSNGVNEGQFRLRGVIQNISTLPIKQLDATVRFYARNGDARETVLVRLDKETIPPDDFARLDLVIPKHTMDYSGYAVEFKLRAGEEIAYKDMRSGPAQR